MKVLIIGGGGREHALAWKISKSKNVESIFCIPGNGGISEIADCVDISHQDLDKLIKFTKQEHIDIVVVGPENPLAIGIVDCFEEKGIQIFGPRKKGALIEASKVFAKQLMDKYDIPTAAFRIFKNYKDASNYITEIDAPFVIKADGLCAGKGAYVVKNKDEGVEVLRDVMVNKIHGEAGQSVIIETFLQGVEASYLAFTDGDSILPMLPSQDHKPLLDNDMGPNTGGMGAYTPIPFIDEKMEIDINSNIMKRTIDAIKSEGSDYRGVLYGGLMIMNDKKPYVIEFNARLGDPETQPILFKMESDIVPIIQGCIDGKLDISTPIKWRGGVSICVVLASKGYPDKTEKGMIISGLDDLKRDKDIMVFHAGTKKIGKDFYTSGGRVLGVTAIGKTYKEAMERVYGAVSVIHFEGMQYRKDIGSKALLFSENGQNK
jgi:phosphoribosylamine--glycine ligase